MKLILLLHACALLINIEAAAKRGYENRRRQFLEDGNENYTKQLNKGWKYS